MRVIYIAGAAHSGSTLLDMMLNAHPEIISVGELVNLDRTMRSKTTGKVQDLRCACGAVGVLQCEFWSRVNHRTKELSGRLLNALDLQHPRSETEVDANICLFRAISDVSGKKIIVDSSKMPRRLNHLLQLRSLKARN
jgi:hypothetical protein